MGKDSEVLVHYIGGGHYPKAIGIRNVLCITGNTTKKNYVLITEQEYKELIQERNSVDLFTHALDKLNTKDSQ